MIYDSSRIYPPTLEEDAFDESPTRSIIRRKSIIREPGRKSTCSNRKNVTFGSLPTELTVRSAKDCLKHMFAVSFILNFLTGHILISAEVACQKWPL